MRRRKAITVLGGLGAASLTGVSFANSTGTSSASIESGEEIEVIPIDGDGREGPQWSPTENTSGSIDAGTLYGIQIPKDWDERVWVTLYYNNPGELSSAYSYLNFNTEIQLFSGDYTVDDGSNIGDWWNNNWDNPDWPSVDESDSEVLTLSSGQVSYSLNLEDSDLVSVENNDGDEYYCYRIRAVDGSYYATDTEDDTNLSPSFYIDVN